MTYSTDISHSFLLKKTRKNVSNNTDTLNLNFRFLFLCVFLDDLKKVNLKKETNYLIPID